MPSPEAPPHPSLPAGPIGVLGAMTEEVALLHARLQGAQALAHGLVRGELAGRAVLLGHSGIGKVNAAAAAARLLGAGARAVVFTGVAGGLEAGLAAGDVVVSRDLAQHDVDVTALGYAPGTVPGESATWAAHPELMALALAAAETVLAEEGGGARAVTGRVLSGDRFVASPEEGRALRERFGGSCAEMEGAAVAQICAQAGVPFVAVRSLSDSADGDAGLDYRELMPRMAERAARVVAELLRRWP